MIVGSHSVIRSADSDDAEALHGLYNPQRPRAWMLDRRREPVQPTASELRELLAQKDSPLGALAAVEDPSGSVQGFCGLRGVSGEAGFAMAVLMLVADAEYDSPLGRESLRHVLQQAFVQKRLNKVIFHCLETEAALRGLLMEYGFRSDGIQRQVVYTQGRWHNVETLTLFRAECPSDLRLKEED